MNLVLMRRLGSRRYRQICTSAEAPSLVKDTDVSALDPSRIRNNFRCLQDIGMLPPCARLYQDLCVDIRLRWNEGMRYRKYDTWDGRISQSILDPLSLHGIFPHDGFRPGGVTCTEAIPQLFAERPIYRGDDYVYPLHLGPEDKEICERFWFEVSRKDSCLGSGDFINRQFMNHGQILTNLLFPGLRQEKRYYIYVTVICSKLPMLLRALDSVFTLLPLGDFYEPPALIKLVESVVGVRPRIHLQSFLHREASFMTLKELTLYFDIRSGRFVQPHAYFGQEYTSFAIEDKLSRRQEDDKEELWRYGEVGYGAEAAGLMKSETGAWYHDPKAAVWKKSETGVWYQDPKAVGWKKSETGVCYKDPGRKIWKNSTF